jgi:hypothetical protein
VDKKPSRKRTPEQIAADRKADADIDLFERISECHQRGELLVGSDAEIAARCEEQFGIPAEDVLAQFGREDNMDFPSVELIMMAQDPHFFVREAGMVDVMARLERIINKDGKTVVQSWMNLRFFSLTQGQEMDQIDQIIEDWYPGWELVCTGPPNDLHCMGGVGLPKEILEKL